jgi:hypothetical protein
VALSRKSKHILKLPRLVQTTFQTLPEKDRPDNNVTLEIPVIQEKMKMKLMMKVPVAVVQ